MPGNFNFLNLDSAVRTLMLEEIHLDREKEMLYASDRFNETGHRVFAAFLLEAAERGTEATLADQLSNADCFNEMEFKAGQWKRVPNNAHTLYAQGEFNRYYIRAICRYLLANPMSKGRIYRARESSKPRPESQAKLGKIIDPQSVLTNLRDRIGAPVGFGLPDINSGLCIEIIVEDTSN